jgi:hypothetical protein
MVDLVVLKRKFIKACILLFGGLFEVFVCALLAAFVNPYLVFFSVIGFLGIMFGSEKDFYAYTDYLKKEKQKQKQALADWQDMNKGEP